MAKQEVLSVEEFRRMTKGARVIVLPAKMKGKTGQGGYEIPAGQILPITWPEPGCGKNKYGAKRTPYNGRVYDSKLEALQAAKLDILLKARKIRSYKPQVKFDLEVNRRLITTYRADFLITHLDGSQEIHECKGRPARDWAMRKKLFEALYPHTPITVITKTKTT